MMKIIRLSNKCSQVYFNHPIHLLIIFKNIIMKKNMGSIDKTVRILIAVAIIVLYFTHQISDTIAIIGLVLSGIFILTSFISFCPLYLPFGISTRKKE